MKRIWYILLAVGIVMASTTVFAAGKTFTVNTPSGVRMREENNTDATIIKTLPNKTEVELIHVKFGDSGKWAKVQHGDDVGYVCYKYLADDADQVTADEPAKSEMTYLGEFMITAYTHTGSPCANGNYPTAGYTVACNSLDFGTNIYIDGVGYRTVEDRGPDYGSQWLDLFCGSYDECIMWGIQYRTVYIVD